MAFHIRFLFFLTGLTGIHSITTVSQVSVKAGESITIPCLYDSQYIEHVKYLCKGEPWLSCSIVVETNSQNSSNFSISDDKSQRIFTVTIKDLTNENAGFYWCAVKIIGWPDVKKMFRLSVTGSPSLYVNPQEITVLKGKNITINCPYRNSGESKWCRLGSSCVTDQSGSIDGTRVTINTRVRDVFNVTMSELRTESSGWYLCVSGGFQMPVHVNVTEQSNITQAPEMHSVPLDLKSFIIPLSVLIFIVIVILFIWFLFKRRKQAKAESSATASAMAQEEVTYRTVRYSKKKKKSSGQVQAKTEV